MKNRDREWHEELSDLLSEEASSHLSRARDALAKKRARRNARERRRDVKEQTRAQLRNDELDREVAKLAVKELENKYSGLGGLPMALVMALAALVIVGVVIFNPQFTPLLFAAFGIAMGAAGVYSSHAKGERLLGQLRLLTGDEDTVEDAPVRTQESPNAAQTSKRRDPPAGTATTAVDDTLSRRFEEACDRLEQALKSAPDEVKTFLSTQSGKTLEQLRATGRDLAQRELRLRELSAPETEARMQADHAALDERISRANDGAVRQSLFQARAALKEKQAHHAQLVQGADRLEAERLRLSYTLEGLHAQILRLSTSTSLGSGALTSPLRASLEQLQDELTALAEASDEVRQMADARIPEAIAEIEGPSTTRDPVTGRPRERS